jgi:signal transduction histidine kinase
MYRRQLISTLSLISLCLILLGAGFFSLYYQYHLNELKKLIEQDIQYISNYASSVLDEESDVRSDEFQRYLSSVAMISNTSILLCGADGTVIYATGTDLDLSVPARYHVPSWVTEHTLKEETFSGLTTFNGLFSHSSYVSGEPIFTYHLVLSTEGVSQAKIPLGLIFIGTDASYVKDFLLNALQLFLLTAAAVLLISLIICSLTSQHMVQPLRAMSAAVYRFAHGDLATRVNGYSDRNDEIGDLARAFNAMAQSLAQAEKRRSEFVANVSHELKTPMTTIAGFADGILDGTIPPSRERDSLEIISSETRRLSRLIRRMLELSRLQSQERIAAQVQFDVSEVLLRVLVSLESKVIEKDLEIVTNLPEAGVMVWGDPDAITQVCYNLLDNAIKFSRQKGILTLSIVLRSGKAYTSIRNQGETIPPDQLTHIFDRFHKVDVSRSEKEGVGLGLYIVKTILNTYKESISVTSENGETEFTFSLSEV